MVKKKSTQWFIRVRGSYLPNSLMGWVTYIPYLAYLLAVLVFVLRRQYNLPEAAFTVVPNWIAAAVVMHWIAANKS